ncbi:MAG: ABC transporter permease [Sandaracinaceae bacterium]|nr:ABC transporter permease [Sandaracinaceae bacterium]
MNPLLYRALASAWRRSLLAASGVATSALLVVVLVASYRNLTSAVESYVGQPGIDLWIAPLGTDNLIRSSALLDEGTLGAARAVPGVRRADPLLRSFVSAHHASDDRAPLSLLVLGYEAPTGLGGPPRITEGRAPRRDREVVLDRASAFQLGVDVGGRVQLNGVETRVVGISDETNLLATQFAFLTRESASGASGFGERVSFVAVQLVRDADGDAVAREIEARLPGVSVYAREQFVERNVREVAAGFRPLLLIVCVVGMAAAAVLVSLLIHAVVDDRARDIAVLLALGAPITRVTLSVLTHAIVLVMVGGALGALLSCAFRSALARWFPTVGLVIHAHDVLTIVLVLCVAALASAYAPLVRLRRIDPVEAFRA